MRTESGNFGNILKEIVGFSTKQRQRASSRHGQPMCLVGRVLGRYKECENKPVIKAILKFRYDISGI